MSHKRVYARSKTGLGAAASSISARDSLWIPRVCARQPGLRSPRRRGPGCVSAWRNVIAPAIEDFHDARKQGGGNHGVTFVREMDEVQGSVAQRDEFIVHNHINRASLQPPLHLRNVCRAPLRRDEETLIVAAR